MMMKLTQQQNAKIYCVKNKHGNYVWTFFGYVYCGRCGTQIGDTLAGIFDTTGTIIVGHKCNTCNKLNKKLSALDKKILGRLEEDTECNYDYTKILKDIEIK